MHAHRYTRARENTYTTRTRMQIAERAWSVACFVERFGVVYGPEARCRAGHEPSLPRQFVYTRALPLPSTEKKVPTHTKAMMQMNHKVVSGIWAVIGSISSGCYVIDIGGDPLITHCRWGLGLSWVTLSQTTQFSNYQTKKQL